MVHSATNYSVLVIIVVVVVVVAVVAVVAVSAFARYYLDSLPTRVVAYLHPNSVHIGALRPRAQPSARVGWASALSKDVVPALPRLACLQRAKIAPASISARRRHLSLPNFVFELAV